MCIADAEYYSIGDLEAKTQIPLAPIPPGVLPLIAYVQPGETHNRATVQIAHGMGEHALRYRPVAHALVDLGLCCEFAMTAMIVGVNAVARFPALDRRSDQRDSGLL